MGFFSRLKAGLSKTRDGFVKNMDYVFSGFSKIDDEFYEELEEILITGDLGVQTSMRLIEDLRREVKDRHIKEPGDCRKLLIEDIRRQMDVGEQAYRFEEETSVLMMVGVNGVGKTTTIGKLAHQFKHRARKRVLIAAADTFRAAANEQLKEWALRAGVDMIGGQEGSDPAAVVFDAVRSAKARNCDILLVDTAGRLHNKTNLMHELEKMNRVIDREYPGVCRETLVVLDATTGQNALVQAREFCEAANATGIVLTKMDGSAKGGIAVAIQSELGIPVKYIGVGETVDDLEKFDPDQYVNALFDLKDEAEETSEASEASEDLSEETSEEEYPESETEKPMTLTEVPAEETEEPAEPGAELTEAPAEPVEPKEKPAEETEESIEPEADLTEELTGPVEPGQELAEETEESIELGADLTEAPAEPTEPVTDLTEELTGPVEPGQELAEETEALEEEPTEATEEPGEDPEEEPAEALAEPAESADEDSADRDKDHRGGLFGFFRRGRK